MTLGNGDSVSLATVLASGSHRVNVGDKIFTFASFSSNAFNVNDVFITGYVASNPLNGIGFDITGGFGDVTAGDGVVSRFDIAYSVAIDSGYFNAGYRLKDIGLAANVSAVGTGSYARVDEQVFDGGVAGNPFLASLAGVANGGGPNTLQDFRDFSPLSYSSFLVTKGVQFYANGTGDTAAASFVRQSFSQLIVPGPGAGALLGLGGMAAMRRRRS